VAGCFTQLYNLKGISMTIPTNKTPTRAEAQRIVNELAEKSMISWSKHARDRMDLRGINTEQVLTCLAKGRVTDQPVLANKGGSASGYDITIERSVAGDTLRIGVCLRFVSQMAHIVTVMKVDKPKKTK
jgi:hypothetical protein